MFLALRVLRALSRLTEEIRAGETPGTRVILCYLPVTMNNLLEPVEPRFYAAVGSFQQSGNIRTHYFVER